MRNTQKAQRKRTIPYIFGSDRLDELLTQLLEDGDWQLRMYVYGMRDQKKVVPAIFVGSPFYDLLNWLRDVHGGGEFHLIIRRNKTIELSGIVCIGAPISPTQLS